MPDRSPRTMTEPDKRGRHSTAIRFDADVYDRLTAESEARMVSINWIVNRLVAEGLERIVPVEDMRLTVDSGHAEMPPKPDQNGSQDPTP